jgi:type 2 lantibiotic biosynthesis protein LanM
MEVDVRMETDYLSKSRRMLLGPMQHYLEETIHKLQMKIVDLDYVNYNDLLRSLTNDLHHNVFQLVSKALVLELNYARVEGLKGDTPEARFSFFCDQLTRKDAQTAFWDKYPVLHLQLQTFLSNWLNATCNLVQRFQSDRDVIAHTFSPDRSIGKIESILVGLGDQHNGGQTVSKLSFDTGISIIYKPRSVAVEQHFQEVLNWTNERSNFHFKTLKIISKQDYGWVEFVDKGDCSNEEEVGSFYKHLGGLLVIFYVLDATDMHSENCIASGQYPVVIDMESLFQPRITTDNEPLDYSVIRTGLLPYKTWKKDQNDSDDGVDLSCFSGEEGQLVPDKEAYWEDEGKDTMHLRFKEATLIGSCHRPTLNGTIVAASHYSDEFLMGFDELYQFLMDHRDDLQECVEKFRHDPIRVIVRSTRTYGLLLRDSNHPKLIQNDEDWKGFFRDHLQVAAQVDLYLKSIIPWEQSALEMGDVPYFITTPNSRDLWIFKGEKLSNFLPFPSIDQVKERFQQLSLEDKDRQSDNIRTSLASLFTKI